LVVVAFLLAIACTFVFAYRAGRTARRLHAANEPIRAWMSIPFIAHTHRVPSSVLFDSIGVHPVGPRDRRSIRHIARQENRPVGDLIRQLQHVIDASTLPPGGPPK